MSAVVELPSLEISESAPVCRQLTDSVRSMIRTGGVKPGARLPSSQTLAQQWKTDAMTVHRALTPLVREGLIERTPGIGTFVRNREKRLTKVCVYEVDDLTSHGGSPFQQAMLKELRRELIEDGIEPDVWLDPRPEAEKLQPWEALIRAAQQRRIQAIILPITGWSQYHWVSKLPIPSAFLGSAHRPNFVHNDLLRMAELGVNALVEQRCRSVGVITCLPRHHQDEPGEVHEYVEYHRRLREVMAERGLRVEETWIRSPRGKDLAGAHDQERFGYEEFQALWNLAERPEGLFVDVDTASQGVIKAALERQVRVPGSLRLVLSRNKHIEFFCPLPVSWCVTDETALARALIELVQKQFRGEKCDGMHVSCSISQ